MDARERVVAFMPEYAAYLLNRLQQGEDGKVAYERVRGKKPTVLGLEFGEKVLYKVRMRNKFEKIRPRWEFGIFVGIKRSSNEVMIATPKGIEYARSVRRVPFDVRVVGPHSFRGGDLHSKTTARRSNAIAGFPVLSCFSPPLAAGP